MIIEKRVLKEHTKKAKMFSFFANSGSERLNEAEYQYSYAKMAEKRYHATLRDVGLPTKTTWYYLKEEHRAEITVGRRFIRRSN